MRSFLQLCGILILAFVLFAISAIGMPHMMPDPPQPMETPTQTPPPTAIQIEETPYHATIQYGTPEVIKDNSGPLYTYIRYPQAGNPTDSVISDWAHRKYSEIVSEFNSMYEDGDSVIGEVNIHFDSYLVDNRYAGVLESGEFSYTLTPLPEVVVKAFNIDLSNNTFLENTDILDFGQSDSLFELLHDRIMAEHPDTSPYLSFIDESWLTNMVIAQDGIIVALERYKFFPETFNTLTVTLPYEDLDSMLLIRTDPPLPPIPSPTPEPLPTPPPRVSDDPDNPQPITVPPQTGDIDPSRPVIAFSFDDGPGKYTDQFLDLFEQYGIRATFCTIGNLVNTQQEALERAVSMGCEVIGHSWDHKNLAKLSADDVRKQIMDTSDTIEAVTGVAVPMFRPPYGATSDTMKEVAAELGFVMVCWNVDPEDWNTSDSDEVYNAVMAQVKDRAIILSHEIYKSTLVAYTRLIPELLSQGYQIVTVSELLYLKYGGNLTPGNVYYNG